MFLVAILTGLVLASIGFGIVYLWFGDLNLSYVVLISLLCVSSVIYGTSTPLVLNKFGVNPALASGPFITTTNDILGIVVYLAIANLYLLHNEKCLIADEMHESILPLLHELGFETYAPKLAEKNYFNLFRVIKSFLSDQKPLSIKNLLTKQMPLK